MIPLLVVAHHICRLLRLDPRRSIDRSLESEQEKRVPTAEAQWGTLAARPEQASATPATSIVGTGGHRFLLAIETRNTS